MLGWIFRRSDRPGYILNKNLLLTRTDEFLGVQEVAELFNVTEDELMNAVCQGRLPGVCINNKWRFSLRALSKFFQASYCYQFNFPGDDNDPPYWQGDLKRTASKVIESYKNGQRYFPELAIDGARFSGLDLREIDFWQSTLKNADFSGANLASASFEGVDLEYANFENANLADATFWCASVERANLKGANLHRTNFQVESMKDVDMSGAKINMAKF